MKGFDRFLRSGALCQFRYQPGAGRDSDDRRIAVELTRVTVYYGKTGRSRLTLKLAGVEFRRNASHFLNYQLGDRHPKAEIDRIRSQVDDLESESSFEPWMNRRCGKMHKKTAPRSGAFSFDSRGQAGVSARNYWKFDTLHRLCQDEELRLKDIWPILGELLGSRLACDELGKPPRTEIVSEIIVRNRHRYFAREAEINRVRIIRTVLAADRWHPRSRFRSDNNPPII